MTEQRSELARTVLSVIFIGGLIGGSLWVLKPFLGALIWATMIVVATWPMMWASQRVLGGRRSARRHRDDRGVARRLVGAALVGDQATLVSNGDVSPDGEEASTTARLPPPPEWVAGLPVVGESGRLGVARARGERRARANGRGPPPSRGGEVVRRQAATSAGSCCSSCSRS